MDAAFRRSGDHTEDFVDSCYNNKSDDVMACFITLTHLSIMVITLTVRLMKSLKTFHVQGIKFVNSVLWYVVNICCDSFTSSVPFKNFFKTFGKNLSKHYMFSNF